LLVASAAVIQSAANVTITAAAHVILALNRVTILTLSDYTGNVLKFVWKVFVA
jgi:hypothetical protein